MGRKIRGYAGLRNFLVVGATLVVLQGCDYLAEQWEGGNARAIIEQYLGVAIDDNEFDIIWRGSKNGNESFIIKANYTAIIGGTKRNACTIVAYSVVGKKLLWNKFTSVKGCGEQDFDNPEVIRKFAEANNLGQGKVDL